MCLNTDIRTHKDASSYYYLAPTYDFAVMECAHIGRYSCVWTILALSNVINTNMDVLYPCVNGTKDLAFFEVKPEADTKWPSLWKANQDHVVQHHTACGKQNLDSKSLRAHCAKIGSAWNNKQ